VTRIQTVTVSARSKDEAVEEAKDIFSSGEIDTQEISAEVVNDRNG
jgi:hypothetical protein